MTHHSRPADFHNVTVGHLQSGLPANHPRAVGEHCDADEWETVIVPGYGWQLLVGDEVNRVLSV
jgi:hypothetical protein